ncbi:MAG: AAA family ATPase, partial [Bacillota bacterium]|nr:AAA family ATPase [Bacillota bacterium]
MRWQTLRLHRFGGLRDFEAKLAPFTVLLGPNEAGKTTLRHALLTLLLGFRQRKGFPWSPWDGSEPHLEGVLEMETDSWTVVRRLLSQPRGHLLGAQGKRRELGNQPLPFLTSQMELLYEDVYTLTAANLVMLKGDLWHQVEEALMGGLQGHLLPVATVRETIVREHESLWHVHKNKGAAARRLLARRQELHQRLLEARGKEEELFRLEEGLNLLEGKMRQVEESLRAEEEREKERIRLESLARRLETVVEKEREAGPLELLAGLPPDPLRTLEMLLHKEEDLRTRWEEKKTYVEELGAAAALSPFERELWVRREEV